MKNYNDFEKKLEENNKKNEKYIREFKKWLTKKGLTERTITKHINNADLYINDYLNYYEANTMEEGVYSVYNFLDNWFIEKCLWSSRNSLKETAASIKKFYECMSENGYIKKEDYKELCREIKDNMDTFLGQMDEYDNEEFYDFF